MRLKHVLWATAAWTLLVIVGSAGLLWYIGTHSTRYDFERRAGQAGSGAGVVAVIGYGLIWLPFCAKVGRQRREAREREREARRQEALAKKKRRPADE